MPFNAGINELQFQNWMSKTLLGRGSEVLDDVIRMGMPEEDPTRGAILEPYPEPSDNKITEPYPEPSDTKITEPYPEPDNPYITEPYPEPQDTKITEPYPEESSHILKSEEGGKVNPLFEFQDKNQERVIHSGWDNGGNSYRYILEGTGDIFRELTKEDGGDIGYIGQKIKRLNDFFETMDRQRQYFPDTGIHPDDSIQRAQEAHPEKIEKMIKLWEKQPVKTKEQELARKLNIAMLTGDYTTAKEIIPQIKAKATKLSPTEE